ncbi:flagellar basal-body rod modification protein FlgD [Roseovarius sp. MBR-78]|jgi:flagellar basal-body rod modification protein FlgD|uniref:flagellar hook capping FlgD N-terminal domain-containing protein n=1 Tax=Roseovarius sp. MBR-78 TaxID=3156460 RepID=UPI003391BBB3
MDTLTGIATGPAATAPVALAAGGAPGPGTTGALSSDFETFLKMLTTQMRNQDPLNPVESADFAVQLATFSSVEQQVRTNELLTGLGAQMATLGMGEFPGWIGLEAEVRAPVRFAGERVQIEAVVDPRADAAELVVSDATGAVVARSALPAESGPVLWAGRDAQGQTLPPGSYTLSVLSQSAGETIARHEAHMRSRVIETRLEGGEVRLGLGNGQSVTPAEVIGLRPPPPE